MFYNRQDELYLECTCYYIQKISSLQCSNKLIFELIFLPANVNKKLISREIKLNTILSHPDPNRINFRYICKESAQFPACLCYIMSHTLLICITGKTLKIQKRNKSKQ